MSSTQLPDLPSVALTLHPEIQALLTDCDALRDQLARLIAEHDLMAYTVGPNLDAEYQAQIGRYELERFRVDLEVRRLRRTLELLQAALNRGESITRNKVAAQLAREYADWEHRMRELAAQLRHAENRLAALAGSEESAEVRRLYRALARRLHPDVNPHLTPEDRKLWLRVAEAYRNGDLDTLRAIMLITHDTPMRLIEAETEPSDACAALRQQRDQLRGHVRRLLDETAALQTVFPFTERQNLADPAWIAQRQAAIQAEVQPLHETRQALEYAVAQLWRVTSDEQQPGSD